MIGLANGLIVAGLKVHGFIATLGMGLIISGYLATNFKGSFGQTPFSFRLIGATGLGPVPISTLIMLACAALVLLMLHGDARSATTSMRWAATGTWPACPASGSRAP